MGSPSRVIRFIPFHPTPTSYLITYSCVSSYSELVLKFRSETVNYRSVKVEKFGDKRQDILPLLLYRSWVTWVDKVYSYVNPVTSRVSSNRNQGKVSTPNRNQDHPDRNQGKVSTPLTLTPHFNGVSSSDLRTHCPGPEFGSRKTVVCRKVGKNGVKWRVDSPIWCGEGLRW